MAHAQKTDFVFQRNGLVHLNRRGRQCIRLLAAELCASALVMMDTPCSEVVWRVLPTPLAIFTFTPSPLCHGVPPHFKWSLPNQTCAVVGYYAAQSGDPVATFRDNLSVPSSGVKSRNLDPWRWDRQIVSEHRYGIANIRRTKSQKSAYLIVIAGEAWNHTMYQIARYHIPESTHLH